MSLRRKGKLDAECVEQRRLRLRLRLSSRSVYATSESLLMIKTLRFARKGWRRRYTAHTRLSLSPSHWARLKDQRVMDLRDMFVSVYSQTRVYARNLVVVPGRAKSITLTNGIFTRQNRLESMSSY